MTDDEVFLAYIRLLRLGFPSDEALALAQGRWEEWNAPEQKDVKEERDGTYR